MMEDTRTLLWLFLLLNQLLLYPANAGQGLSTHQSITNNTEDPTLSSPRPVEASLTTLDHTNFPDTDTNATRADCLIDTEMGLIAIGSAGGLIVCLLVATIVLACQICHIQQRIYAPRTTRSNMDLVSSASYWDNEQPEMGGMAGPCDASVVLEEVRAESKMEEERQAGIQEERKEGGAGLDMGTMAISCEAEERASLMECSGFKDSCLEVPRDLEDIPLVV